MKSKVLLGTAAFIALSALAPLAAHAAGNISTTKSVSVPGATTVVSHETVIAQDNSVSDIPADEDSMKADEGADAGVTVDTDESAAATSTSTTPATDTDSHTLVTTTTTTDTVTVPVPGEPNPVVAPSVTGHKPGDRKDTHDHAATGAEEATTAGDKAAKAITPLEDSSVPADADVQHEITMDKGMKGPAATP